MRAPLTPARLPLEDSFSIFNKRNEPRSRGDAYHAIPVSACMALTRARSICRPLRPSRAGRPRTFSGSLSAGLFRYELTSSSSFRFDDPDPLDVALHPCRKLRGQRCHRPVEGFALSIRALLRVAFSGGPTQVELRLDVADVHGGHPQRLGGTGGNSAKGRAASVWRNATQACSFSRPLYLVCRA